MDMSPPQNAVLASSLPSIVKGTKPEGAFAETSYTNEMILRRFVLTIVLGVVLMTGCSKKPRIAVNWEKAELGMAQAEVRKLFGEPTTRHGPAEIHSEGDSEPTTAAAAGLGAFFFGGLEEWWEYEPPDFGDPAISRDQENQRKAELLRKLKTLPKEKLKTLPEDERRKLEKFAEEFARGLFGGPSDEAFVVYFDSQGRVKGLRAPATGPYAKYTSAGSFPQPPEAKDFPGLGK